MPDYTKGKIYCLRSSKTEQVYIGSTVQTLSNRLCKHKTTLRNQKWKISSSIILEHKDAYIELIENYPCETKAQLNRREGEVIRNTPNCCNIQVAGRTQKEYQQDNKVAIRKVRKAYIKKHEEKTKEYHKQYAETHKEQVEAYKKAHYERNKELIKQRSKAYYQANKVRANELQKARTKRYQDKKKLERLNSLPVP